MRAGRLDRTFGRRDRADVDDHVEDLTHARQEERCGARHHPKGQKSAAATPQKPAPANVAEPAAFRKAAGPAMPSSMGGRLAESVLVRELEQGTADHLAADSAAHMH